MGGFINSNPEIIGSYPDIGNSLGDTDKILEKCLPLGSKVGEFIEDKFKKHLILSYIFKVRQEDERDDLFSFTVLLGKRDKLEIYKPVIKEMMNHLEFNGLLKEHILCDNQEIIYKGINEECNIKIENLQINLSKIFKDIKGKVLKEKPQLKGSFL